MKDKDKLTFGVFLQINKEGLSPHIRNLIDTNQFFYQMPHFTVVYVYLEDFKDAYLFYIRLTDKVKIKFGLKGYSFSFNNPKNDVDNCKPDFSVLVSDSNNFFMNPVATDGQTIFDLIDQKGVKHSKKCYYEIDDYSVNFYFINR